MKFNHFAISEGYQTTNILIKPLKENNRYIIISLFDYKQITFITVHRTDFKQALIFPDDEDEKKFKC